MLRSLLERLSRERVIRRRLPARAGGDALFVSPDAALKHWKPGLEHVSPDLIDFAEEFVRPGDVVWDVGANVGLFAFASAYFARASGKVIAIEPDVFCAQLLRRSAQSAGKDRAPVIVIPAAVDATLGVQEFHVAARGISSSHLASVEGRSQTGGTRHSVHVVTLTLDWLLERFPAPAAMKIDVEGSEAQVLRGASRLLESAHPTLFCEVGEENVDACTEIFLSHRYRMCRLEDRDRRPLERAGFNTLCVFEP